MNGWTAPHFAAFATLLWIGSLGFGITSPIELLSAFAIAQEEQTPATVYHAALEAFRKKDYATAEKLLRQVLAQNSRYQEPSGRSAWRQLGIALERQEKSLEAIKVMQQGRDTLSTAQASDWHLNYDLARLYAEHASAGKEAYLTDLVYAVFKNSTPEQQPDLWQRLYDETAFMLDEPERAQFKKALAEKGGKPGRLLLRFFRREDVAPVTPPNEALITYFQRAAAAKAQFAYAQAPRGFDDRGDLYVRFGKPWRVYTDHSGLMGDVGWAFYPYEVWFYNPLHPDLYYTFIRKEGQFQYTLVDGPEFIYGPFYRGRSTFFNRDTRGVPRRGERPTLGRSTLLNQPNAGETAMKLRDQIYAKLAPSHENFRRRLYEISNTRSDAEALDYSLLHFTNEDRKHAARVDSIAPAVVFSEDYKAKSLPMLLSFSRFQDEAGKTRTEVYYGGLYRDVKFKRSPAGHRALLRGEIVILNDEYEVVASDSIQQNCLLPSSATTDSGGFVSQANFLLPPAQYHLSFRIENQDEEQVGSLAYDLDVNPFPEKSLSLSDLQLSSLIREAEAPHRFVKNGYFVTPLPSLTIDKTKPLFVYFEIYHLALNNLGETNYQIDYRVYAPEGKKGFFKKLFGGNGKKHSITLSASRQGNSPTQVEHVELDLGKLDSNNLELEIVVTDVVVNKQASTKLPFKLVER
jgi:GWxTD domain-containing protein